MTESGSGLPSPIDREMRRIELLGELVDQIGEDRGRDLNDGEIELLFEASDRMVRNIREMNRRLNASNN